MGSNVGLAAARFLCGPAPQGRDLCRSKPLTGPEKVLVTSSSEEYGNDLAVMNLPQRDEKESYRMVSQTGWRK